MADTPKDNPEAGDSQQGPPTAGTLIGENGPQATPGTERIKIQWPVAFAVFIGLGGVIAASSLFYWAAHWMEERIDKAVEKKLSEPYILRKIAAEARPALVFNSYPSVVTDMGAGPLVKSIEITQRNPDGWPKTIVIEFTRHITNPPIVTSMHELSRIVPSRDKLFAWRFEVDDHVQHYILTNLWTFRLEIYP